MTATVPVMLGQIRRMVTLTVDGDRGARPEGATILDALHDEGGAEPGRHPHAVLGAQPDPDQRLPGVRGRGRGLAGARAVVRAQGRGRHGGAHRHREGAPQPPDGAGAARVVGRPLPGQRRRAAVDGATTASTPHRYGPPAPPAAERDTRHAGHHHAPDGSTAETVAQPVKIDNDLYVRDYARCILCYKCVKACGTDAQFTFAISAAGRGFDARIATE